jgi:hypothetical protein
MELKVMMLVVSVSLDVALRNRVSRVGEQAVTIDFTPLDDSQAALLSRRLVRIAYEHIAQARYTLRGRNGVSASLAMPTAKINPETVAEALVAWVRDELAYEASLAAAIVEASERGTLDEMIVSSTHYPTSTDVGTIGFKVGSAAYYLSTLCDSHEALKLMEPALEAARSREKARAKASYLGRSLADLIVYQTRRCRNSPRRLLRLPWAMLHPHQPHRRHPLPTLRTCRLRHQRQSPGLPCGRHQTRRRRRREAMIRPWNRRPEDWPSLRRPHRHFQRCSWSPQQPSR